LQAREFCYVDKKTGELIGCQVFIACLHYSDYGFAMDVKANPQKTFFMPLAAVYKILEVFL
jgi:hypothetical protein